MGMNIPARDAENQNRNRLCCQTDLSRVRASAAADRLLKWNSEFLRKLFRILDKHRIGNIALIHPADLDTAPHVSLGLGRTEIKIIRWRSLKNNRQIRTDNLGCDCGTSCSNLLLSRKRSGHPNCQLILLPAQTGHGVDNTCTARTVIKCFSKAEVTFLIVGK